MRDEDFDDELPGKASLMKNTGTLSVSLPSEREIALTRVFKAPRQLVYHAFSKPEILKR